MKVLWLCNVPLVNIAVAAGIPPAVGGGWLQGLFEDLPPEIQLSVAAPYGGKQAITGSAPGTGAPVSYLLFPRAKKPHRYNPACQPLFLELLQRERPEVIHIWGVEYPHALAMCKSAQKLGMQSKLVISIQGLCSVYARHYAEGLPFFTRYAFTLRDLLKLDTIALQAKKYALRGKFEEPALRMAGHIIGRTDWDRACSLRINPQAIYHFCNETLRTPFYNAQWRYESCTPHSLFISQANYPVKGLHTALQAFREVLASYPGAHLTIAGENITSLRGLNRLRGTWYGEHIRRLIKKWGLGSHVTFTGPLPQEQMREQFLRANVFVSPSTIENSPNSVGEAMLLGMPVVTSDVGGVKNMLTHESEGFLYQQSAPYMLAFYIKKIFALREKAQQMGERARGHALSTHSRAANLAAMLAIYRQVAK